MCAKKSARFGHIEMYNDKFGRKRDSFLFTSIHFWLLFVFILTSFLSIVCPIR